MNWVEPWAWRSAFDVWGGDWWALITTAFVHVHFPAFLLQRVVAAPSRQAAGTRARTDPLVDLRSCERVRQFRIPDGGFRRHGHRLLGRDLRLLRIHVGRETALGGVRKVRRQGHLALALRLAGRLLLFHALRDHERRECGAPRGPGLRRCGRCGRVAARSQGAGCVRRGWDARRGRSGCSSGRRGRSRGPSTKQSPRRRETSSRKRSPGTNVASTSIRIRSGCATTSL